MRGPRAYWFFASCLIALVLVSSAQVQLKVDAEAEEVDGHLFGECPSEATGKLVSYCSSCRTRMLRDSEDAVSPIRKYEVCRSGTSASSFYPYWARSAEGPVDEASRGGRRSSELSRKGE